MYDYLTYGAGCTQVEVDCITGEVTVLSTDIVMDVGRSINPAIGNLRVFRPIDLRLRINMPCYRNIRINYHDGLLFCTIERCRSD